MYCVNMPIFDLDAKSHMRSENGALVVGEFRVLYNSHFVARISIKISCFFKVDVHTEFQTP